eukprot:CAMPEP_0183387094 /NCGR_PEP_ID=MMETSP0370-20130417/2904_1 /TAXON_ID=268820 /ORGANISM="Peridinium aciculiferum, Strain PAER-2" /LENGTH=85 /DNA_ID=CAMNT_0025565577 /DNA_START=42 /DNA_END=296 /DNA_ORIENTATION=-
MGLQASAEGAEVALHGTRQSARLALPTAFDSICRAPASPMYKSHPTTCQHCEAGGARTMSGAGGHGADAGRQRQPREELLHQKRF